MPYHQQDHCAFSDSPEVDPGGTDHGGTHDGLLDISHNSNFITISWCHFYNHNKTCLLGYSDNSTDEQGNLKTSYHHNWFDNTTQRHPRVRYAECHVFNNYYDGTKGGTGMGTTGYGIASTDSADVVVEANYFDSVKAPTHIGEGNSGPGDLLSINNRTVNSGPILTQGATLDPNTYYSYTPDDPEKIPAMVKKYAGSGTFDFVPTGINDTKTEIIPNDFALEQNYPNPFNPSTIIKFSVPSVETLHATSLRHIILKIYDMLGREIQTLVNESKIPGNYEIKFEANNLPSGIYFYTFQAGNFTSTKKMIYLK